MEERIKELEKTLQELADKRSSLLSEIQGITQQALKLDGAISELKRLAKENAPDQETEQK